MLEQKMMENKLGVFLVGSVYALLAAIPVFGRDFTEAEFTEAIGKLPIPQVSAQKHLNQIEKDTCLELIAHDRFYGKQAKDIGFQLDLIRENSSPEARMKRISLMEEFSYSLQLSSAAYKSLIQKKGFTQVHGGSIIPSKKKSFAKVAACRKRFNDVQGNW